MTHLTGHLQYTSPFFQPLITVVKTVLLICKIEYVNVDLYIHPLWLDYFE